MEEEPKPRKCTNPLCEQPDKTTGDFHRRRDGRDGLMSWCKACQARKTKQEKQDNPIPRLESQRKHKYKVSVERQRELFDKQGGKCLICAEVLDYRKACLDHDHETNVVRGFLCDPCNVALGRLRDDPRIARRAAAYLQAFGSTHPDPHSLLLNLRSIGGF